MPRTLLYACNASTAIEHLPADCVDWLCGFSLGRLAHFGMTPHDIVQRLDTQHRLKCFQQPITIAPCADGDCAELALDTAGRALAMGQATLAEACFVAESF
eukprot:3106924-Amphidinium_carterae.3